MSLTRVYDSDILEHARLKEIAVEYALNYRGNFDFMIQAKLLAQQADLTPQIMRAVLNCLKYDPEAYDLWSEVNEVILGNRPNLRVIDSDEYDDSDDRPEVPASRRSTPTRTKRRGRPVEEHSRWVHTTALIKTPFGVASFNAPHMRVLHRPDPYATIEWEFPLNQQAIVHKRAVSWYHPSWPQDFIIGASRVPVRLHFKWLCGKQATKAEFLYGIPEDLIPNMAARPCRLCDAVYNGEEV